MDQNILGLDLDCNCNAYSFTHVMGIASCCIEDLCAQACNYCHHNCDTAEFDHGIGVHDFLGVGSNDIRLLKLSECCGELIINPETGAMIPDHKLKEINEDF